MYIVWNVQEAENVGILASLKISHFPFWFPTLKGSIREREGNEKNPFPKFGNGKGMKKSIPKIREREGNEKNPFPKFGNGKGMKKSIPKVRERESEASILGNDREREFPLTPGTCFWEPFYGNSSKLSQAPSSGRVSPTSRSSSLPSSPSLACSPGPVCGRTRRPWGDS